MNVTCKKCGHVNEAPTHAPDEACPSCGAIYARVDALIQKQRGSIKRARLKSISKEEPPRRWVTPVAAKFVYGFVMLMLVLATAISFASGAASVLLVGTTVATALIGWIMVEAVLVLFVISEDAAHIRRHLAVLRARAELEDDQT